MNDAEALAQARTALRAWGAPPGMPRLIKNRENAVFEVVGPDARRAALRLHRPGYQSDAAIRSELIWAEGLAARGMTVPRPVPTRDADVIARVGNGGWVASLVTWCEGVPLGEAGVDLAWSQREQGALYRALGAELARLHEVSDALSLPPDFARPVLDEAGLLGEAPLWGRFWENPSLAPTDVALLQQARTGLRNVLQRHRRAAGDFGLIHADALRENVLVQGGAVTLIDFDDGAFGFRLYELGVAMSQNWQLPNAADLAAALLEGYGSRRALSTTERALLPAFITLRALASCGWAIGRYAPDAPELAAYGTRAVAAAQRFVAGQGLF